MGRRAERGGKGGGGQRSIWVRPPQNSEASPPLPVTAAKSGDRGGSVKGRGDREFGIINIDFDMAQSCASVLNIYQKCIHLYRSIQRKRFSTTSACWVLRCFLTSDAEAAVYLQLGHLCGFTPVCRLRSCSLSELGFWKSEKQKLHL